MQTPDKKKLMFLDMQEHPEKYSDEQMEAMMDELDQMPDAGTAWQKFEQNNRQTALHPSRSWWKAAATFIGILMVSGIAFAAIHFIRHAADDKGVLNSPTEETRISNSHQQTAEADTTTTPQPKLYDNVPLGEIFKDLSDYYHVNVVYRNEDAPRLRLYYQWKPEYPLEKVVEMLNNFNWIQIQAENDTLFIRTTAIPAKDC